LDIFAILLISFEFIRVIRGLTLYLGLFAILWICFGFIRVIGGFILPFQGELPEGLPYVSPHALRGEWENSPSQINPAA